MVLGSEKKCSSCMYAARKNRYINTIPSIHTCMNKSSKYYLKDNVWSDKCAFWELMPEPFLNIK